MAKSTMVSLGIPGLDLVLGGGLSILHRLPGGWNLGQESATLLVRGGAGAGKTILGAHIAAALASDSSRENRRDIAYACIEILPTELEAQLQGFEITSKLPIVMPGGKRPKNNNPALRAEMIDLPGNSRGRDPLGEALVQMLDNCERDGFSPGVLVVDSLSDGYRIGRSVKRAIADGICKLAVERGLFLVLLEETTDAHPSPWAFAVDTVLELTHRIGEGTGLQDRLISITKSRFSATDAGPHALVFEDRQVFVMPRPKAYLWTLGHAVFSDLFTARNDGHRTWNIQELDSTDWRFSSSVTAIVGVDLSAVQKYARTIGKWVHNTRSININVDVQKLPVADGHQKKKGRQEDTLEIRCGHPFLSAERLCHLVMEAIREADATELAISVVRIGNLQALRTARDERGLREAIAVLSAFLIRSNVPVVLYETIEARYFAEGVVEQPPGADHADSLIQIVPRILSLSGQPTAGSVYAVDLHSGRKIGLRVPGALRGLVFGSPRTPTGESLTPTKHKQGPGGSVGERRKRLRDLAPARPLTGHQPEGR